MGARHHPDSLQPNLYFYKSRPINKYIYNNLESKTLVAEYFTTFVCSCLHNQ